MAVVLVLGLKTATRYDCRGMIVELEEGTNLNFLSPSREERRLVQVVPVQLAVGDYGKAGEEYQRGVLSPTEQLVLSGFHHEFNLGSMKEAVTSQE